MTKLHFHEPKIHGSRVESIARPMLRFKIIHINDLAAAAVGVGRNLAASAVGCRDAAAADSIGQDLAAAAAVVGRILLLLILSGAHSLLLLSEKFVVLF